MPFPFVLLSRGEHIQIIPTDPRCDTVTLAWFYYLCECFGVKMNKFAALLAAGMLLSGCVYNSKVSTGAEQLQHHRFVLTSVNGQAVNASDRPLELSFGEKMAITGKMYVSGNMCNGFSGEGKVSDGELKVKSLAMTRMLCHDAQLNTLDATIGKMLREGAQVDLTENQLTLATADQTLVYKLADLMH